MMQHEACDRCGGELEFRREGSVQGLYCKNCGWAQVTTYIQEIELDETKYKVFVSGGDFHNESHVRAVSKVSGLNFVAARKLLQDRHATVLEDVATKVRQALITLSAAGLQYEIRPPFKWGESDE